jgi:hypothetical protein
MERGRGGPIYFGGIRREALRNVHGAESYDEARICMAESFTGEMPRVWPWLERRV